MEKISMTENIFLKIPEHAQEDNWNAAQHLADAAQQALDTDMRHEKTAGRVLCSLFKDGARLRNEQDFIRMSYLMQEVHELARYAGEFDRPAADTKGITAAAIGRVLSR